MNHKKGHRRGNVYGLGSVVRQGHGSREVARSGRHCTMNGWEVWASTGSGQCFIVRICTEFIRVTR